MQSRDLLSIAPENWTEDEAWLLFADLLTRDIPLPGLAEVLHEYRATFSEAYARISHENDRCLGQYNRTATGKGIVNPLNTDHLTRLLYLFMRRAAEEKSPQAMLDGLFYVMKTRCNINLFYKTRLGDYFFAHHALGAVIGYGEYGRFLQIQQGCTIGQNHNEYPIIGDALLMGPHSTILGNCRIGRNVLIAANALVVDRNIPDDTVVFGRVPDLILKPNSQDNRAFILDVSMDLS